MNTKTLSLLGVATFVLVVGAFVLIQQQDTTNTSGTPLVFPNLQSAMNDVHDMTVVTSNGKITIRPHEDSWRIQEKSGYYADMGKVRKTIIGLAELRIVEPKTQNPDLYERLGLQDVDTDGSSSVGVTFKDKSGNNLADIIVGNKRIGKGAPGREEVYIRKPGTPQTWLATGQFEVERISEEWLDKTILNFPPKRINRVHILHPDKTAVTLRKDNPEDTDYKILGLPPNTKVKSQFTVNNIVSTLSNVSLDDVAPAEQSSVKEDTGVRAALETIDGLRATVTLVKKDGKTYVTVSSGFDRNIIQKLDQAPKKGDNQEISKEQGFQDSSPNAKQADESEPKTPKMKSEEDVQAEVAGLNQRLQGWVFTIPEFRAENIRKTLTDLIEKES